MKQSLVPSIAQPPASGSRFGMSSGDNNSGGPSLFSIATGYVDRVLPADRTMKVLLVDSATLPIISMSYSQTHLLNKGVFLVDNIAAGRQRREMKTMRCVAFIRPTPESVDAACRELQLAKYSGYTVVFCGACSSPELLERLARADAGSLVTQVEEVFCDYCAVNRDAFTLEVSSSQNFLLASQQTTGQTRRIAEGLAAMTVATRRRPLLRFQKSSPFARRVVAELEDIYKRSPQLYDYRHRDAVLLILDRSDDPVTALLTPWTYQAMLHEHIGLHHNTCALPEEVKGAEKEGYVFSEQDDLFFSANMFLNWGDLCNNVRTYAERCKAALNLDRSTATMEEIKQFMQKMPQTRSLTGSATKHTTVVAHLSSLVKARDLLEVSLLEQDMVAAENESEHWARLLALAGRSDKSSSANNSNSNKTNDGSGGGGAAAVQAGDLLRLCLLFHLRYEKAGQPSRTAPILDRMGSQHTALLTKLREYYGRDRPVEALFAERGGVMSKIVKTFVDVGNIYTQHQPVLRRTLQQCLSGRLDASRYPWAVTAAAAAPQTARNDPMTHLTNEGGFRPAEVLVYMCGGFTFEEAALVHGVNAGTAFKPAETAGFLQPQQHFHTTGAAASPSPSPSSSPVPSSAAAAAGGTGGGGVRVVLGGDTTLNTAAFICGLSSIPL